MSIVFSEVNLILNDVHILHDINISLLKPRIACIGCNGSGKSSLARVACGVIPVTKGTLTIYDSALPKDNTWQKVNMCFQIPERQIVMPSVEEELRFGLENAQFSTEVIQQKVDYALSILDVNSKHTCHALSEGKKRMLCILALVLLEPKTIFLDEPTTFLDMPNKKKLLAFLETIEQQIIFITQDTDITKTFDCAFCIHKGRIHAEGTGSEVLREYKKLW